MDDREGQQIGQYRLIRHIGQGGFGKVYMGEHITLKTRVAIKLLPSDLSREEGDKFLAQVRIASAFNHPHIIRILEFGEENATPFLVMDYAPNGSLRELHPRGTQLPLTTIVSYVKQIADALQYIHDQNMIHRDIKPHNMLLGANHEILLSDFGIAVASESMGYRRQKVQEFEGTILYAAPEQIRGRSRFASDQYALGVLVYEWLSGSCPFYGTVEEVASQHTLVPPPPLREKLPTISPAIEQVVLKALAKDVDKRFESVQAFAIALERASRLEHASKRQSTPHPLNPSTPLPLTIPSSQERDATTQEVLLTYHGHSDKIQMLAWSPDGSSIASSSLDETIKLWNAITGETTLTYHGNSLQASVFAWSPDGRYIASTNGLSSEEVRVWDTASGHPPRNILLLPLIPSRYTRSPGHLMANISPRPATTPRSRSGTLSQATAFSPIAVTPSVCKLSPGRLMVRVSPLAVRIRPSRFGMPPLAAISSSTMPITTRSMPSPGLRAEPISPRPAMT